MIEGRVPDERRARAVEQYLILGIDHGFNASTFTARVITSTGADLGAAVVGAIGALSGPLHGGAPSRALVMLDRIGTPADIADVVVFLCSDLARFVTGQNLVADGGMTLHGSGIDGVLDVVTELLSQR